MISLWGKLTKSSTGKDDGYDENYYLSTDNGQIVSVDGTGYIIPKISDDAIEKVEYVPLDFAGSKIKDISQEYKQLQETYKKNLGDIDKYYQDLLHATKIHYEDFIRDVKSKAIRHVEIKKQIHEISEKKIKDELKLSEKTLDELRDDLANLNKLYQEDIRQLKADIQRKAQEIESNVTMIAELQDLCLSFDVKSSLDTIVGIVEINEMKRTNGLKLDDTVERYKLMEHDIMQKIPLLQDDLRRVEEDHQEGSLIRRECMLKMTELLSAIEVESMKRDIEQLTDLELKLSESEDSCLQLQSDMETLKQQYEQLRQAFDDQTLSINEMQVQYELEQSELIASHSDHQSFTATQYKKQLNDMETKQLRMEVELCLSSVVLRIVEIEHQKVSNSLDSTSASLTSALEMKDYITLYGDHILKLQDRLDEYTGAANEKLDRMHQHTSKCAQMIKILEDSKISIVPVVSMNDAALLSPSSPASTPTIKDPAPIDPALLEERNRLEETIQALRVQETALVGQIDEIVAAHDQLQQNTADLDTQKEQCKNDIKDWCTHFTEVNGREPDVKDKAQIKDKYQKYKVLTGEAKTNAANENIVAAKEKDTKQMLDDVRSKIKELLDQLEKTIVMITVASSSPPVEASIEQVESPHEIVVAVAVVKDDNAAAATVIEPVSIITTDEEVGRGPSEASSSLLNNAAVASQIDDAVILEEMAKINNSIDALRVVESKLIHEIDEIVAAHVQLQQKVVDMNNEKELCKNDIKDWCTHFAEVNGREPDVKDKAQIKDKYQKYKVLTGEAKNASANETAALMKENETKQMIEDVRSKIQLLMEELENISAAAAPSLPSSPAFPEFAQSEVTVEHTTNDTAVVAACSIDPAPIDPALLEVRNRLEETIQALRVQETALVGQIDEIVAAHVHLQQKVVDMNNEKEQCKNDIKDWCTHFAEVNGREPDVKDKAQIKDKYQKYKVLTGEAKNASANETAALTKENETKQMIEDVRSKIQLLMKELGSIWAAASPSLPSSPALPEFAQSEVTVEHTANDSAVVAACSIDPAPIDPALLEEQNRLEETIQALRVQETALVGQIDEIVAAHDQLQQNTADLDTQKEQCKNDIKDWCTHFAEVNGREPDVKDKAQIKDKYQKYKVLTGAVKNASANENAMKVKEDEMEQKLKVVKSTVKELSEQLERISSLIADASSSQSSPSVKHPSAVSTEAAHAMDRSVVNAESQTTPSEEGELEQVKLLEIKIEELETKLQQTELFYEQEQRIRRDCMMKMNDMLAHIEIGSTLKSSDTSSSGEDPSLLSHLESKLNLSESACAKYLSELEILRDQYAGMKLTLEDTLQSLSQLQLQHKIEQTKSVIPDESDHRSSSLIATQYEQQLNDMETKQLMMEVELCLSSVVLRIIETEHQKVSNSLKMTKSLSLAQLHPSSSESELNDATSHYEEGKTTNEIQVDVVVPQAAANDEDERQMDELVPTGDIADTTAEIEVTTVKYDISVQTEESYDGDAMKVLEQLQKKAEDDVIAAKLMITELEAAHHHDVQTIEQLDDELFKMKQTCDNVIGENARLEMDKQLLTSEVKLLVETKRTDIVKKYEEQIEQLHLNESELKEKIANLTAEKLKNEVKITEFKNRADAAEIELRERDEREQKLLDPKDEKALLKGQIIKQRNDIILKGKAATAGWDAAADADERLDNEVERAFKKGLNQERDSHKESMKALNQAIENKENRITELLLSISEMERKILQRDETVKQMKTENDSLKLEVADTIVTLSQLGMGTTTDGGEGSVSNAELDAVKEQLDNAQEELVTLIERCERLEQELVVSRKKNRVYEQLATITGINNLEAAKSKVMQSVKATSNAGKTVGANFDIFEVKTNINKAIVKGTNLWKSNRKDEVFDVYLDCCQDSFSKVLSSELRNIFSDGLNNGRSLGIQNKQRGAVVLRKTMDKVLSELDKPNIRAAEENEVTKLKENAAAALEAKIEENTTEVKDLVDNLNQIENSFLEQGYTKEKNPSNSSAAGGEATTPRENDNNSASLLARAKNAEAMVASLKKQLATVIQVTSSTTAATTTTATIQPHNTLTSDNNDENDNEQSSSPSSSAAVAAISSQSNVALRKPVVAGADPAEIRQLNRKIKDLEAKLKSATSEDSNNNTVDVKASKQNEKIIEKKLKDAETLHKRELKNLEMRAVKAENALKKNESSTGAMQEERDYLKEENIKLKAEVAEIAMLRNKAEHAIEIDNALKVKTAEYDLLSEQFKKETALRKKYKNELEDLKGAIRVYARCRPMAKYEIEKGCKTVVVVKDETSMKLITTRGEKEFEFDAVFSDQSTQDAVFEDTKRLVESCIDGFNVCLFAYGQTGSGKTFTMTGTPSMPGLTPKAIDELYRLIDERKHLRITVTTYFVELYNDNLVDLYWVLDNKANMKNSNIDPPKLEIKMDDKKMVFIRNSIIKEAYTPSDLMELFNKGNLERHTGATKMNAESSRSHSIFAIMVECYDKATKRTTTGKLSLVDLAGSERADKTGAQADRLKEAQSINKSLSALGDVIAALSEGGSKHIPYRNNKLTQLMQDSLGGNAKTLMFVNFSPADYNADETSTSLMYASRVKKIVNNASKQAESEEVARLKQIIKKLRAGQVVEEEDVMMVVDGPSATAAVEEDDKVYDGY